MEQRTRNWKRLACGLLVLIFLTGGFAFAQREPQTTGASPTAPFDLRDGDRVVFMGSSLFENDFQYGYLETALTTRWPDRDVTFRNLGWTGDNVFGIARSTITNPPTGYELLMEQLAKTQPTLVFVAYGSVESQEGEAGLPVFREGLAKLLDKIDQLGAKAILLSPIPILTAESAETMVKGNARLELYASAIARMASERGKRYIDLFSPIQALGKRVTLTDNGIHLNEAGYYHLAATLEKSLGLAPRFEPVTIQVSNNKPSVSGPVSLVNAGNKGDAMQFTLNDRYLPLPLPIDTRGIADKGGVLKITGLKKGFYTLTQDKTTVVTASANEWEEGVAIKQGNSFVQARELQQMIIRKNELFYFQYRPINTTYILGFRSYEQGSHVKDLEDQSILIKWLESQIALTRSPKSTVYQLTLLK